MLRGDFDAGVLRIASIVCFNNKISLHPRCAKESLHFDSLVERALLALPTLLVTFLTVLAECVLVRADVFTRRALRTSKEKLRMLF